MTGTRYAIICAPHSGNSGMFSVDLAAEHFFSERNASYTLFVAQKDRSENFQNYRLLGSLDALEGYSHIVYWGDFLNNPIYGYGDFPRRSVKWGITQSKHDAIGNWKKIFNPTRIPPGAKVFSIGGNFQHDFSKSGNKFNHIFKRMERNFEAILPRDTVSVQNLSAQFGSRAYQKILPGIDCAFLQNKVASVEMKEKRFVYFFRRSKLENPLDLVRKIESELGYIGINLHNWLKLESGNWENTFAGLKKQVAEVDFVITDTYHLCINAMQSRVPVIGVGRSAQEQSGSIGDFKKKILFQMFDLEDFYLEIAAEEEEAEMSRRLLAKLGACLHRFGSDANPYYLVKAKTREFSSRVERALGLTRVSRSQEVVSHE